MLLEGTDDVVDDKYCLVESEGYADGSAVGSTKGSAVINSCSMEGLVSEYLEMKSVVLEDAAMERSSDIR